MAAGMLIAALATLGRLPLQSSNARCEILRSQRLLGAVKRVHFAICTNCSRTLSPLVYLAER